MSKTKLMNSNVSVCYLIYSNQLIFGLSITTIGKKKAHEHVIHRKKSEKTRLIPKPAGSAGKTPPKGYNLQDAMGLTDRKRKYNMLSVRIPYLLHVKLLKCIGSHTIC